MHQFETLLKAVTAGAAGVLGYMLGGWSALLEIVLILILLDYITGMIASGMEGKLSSKIGAKGIAKKVVIVLMVAVAHFIDKALGESLGFGSNVIRDTTCGFYAANELLSIMENAGRSGIKVPDIFTKIIQVLKERGSQHDDNHPKG